MSRYKFIIEAYFTQDNYLEIDAKEKELFEIYGKKVILKSIDGEIIKQSEGIKIECGMFDNLLDCIKLAKNVYADFIFRLSVSHISYFLDKASKGNFCKYCKDDDASIYKEIIIIDTLDENDGEIYAILRQTRMGCTHFKFDKLLNLSLDEKIKNSILINNYRKYLCRKELNSLVDNTLISSSIEMLINPCERNESEKKVLKEVCNYLEEKFKTTGLVEYKRIEQMVKNNKHKSIRSLKRELIQHYSPTERVEENLELIEKISQNRTNEIHTIKSELKKDLSGKEQLLCDIQVGYMKELFDNKNK